MHKRTSQQHQKNFLSCYMKYGNMQIIFWSIFSRIQTKFRICALNLWITKVKNKLWMKSTNLSHSSGRGSATSLRSPLPPIYFFPSSFYWFCQNFFNLTKNHSAYTNSINSDTYNLKIKKPKKLTDFLHLRKPNGVKDSLTW